LPSSQPASSPKAIARRLNADHVPGPRGELRRDTTIRGHRQRGTGILTNELYLGRLVWNRLRYAKDPSTGRGVSRANEDAQRVVNAVPELRIVEDALWRAVKARQKELAASPVTQKIRATRFWERRRAVHLLTGLLVCELCGGCYASVGRDYLACGNARKLGTCAHRTGVRRGEVEELILDLLRDRLLAPEAVQAFVAGYTEELNRDRAGASNRRVE
jgi:site-specific DNA recombinase